MKNKKSLFALLVCAVVVMGCKTDSEEDIPGWGDEDKPQITTAHSVVLNEICGSQDPDDDWVEFYNAGKADDDLSGMKLIKTDENGSEKDIYTFPQGSIVKPGEFKVVATLTGELQAGISNKKQVGLRLEATDGKIVDMFDRDADLGKDVKHDTNGSYARVPDGTGGWTIVATYTRGKANGSK